MQQFVVPQFIEVEDKIFGPITTRQFLIILAAALVIFIAYKFADFTLFLIILVAIGGLALTFAFVKVNGQTFHYFLLNILQTARRPSLRVWNKNYTEEELNYLRQRQPEEIIKKEARKPVRTEHIRNLSLVVNTGGFYRPEDDF